MKRTVPLARSLRKIKQRRSVARRSERVLDPVYVKLVHEMPCWLWVSDPSHKCDGQMEADHAGSRPMGRKCDDLDVVPLCQLAHRTRTDWSGSFKAWDQERMRSWLEDGIEWTQAMIAARLAVSHANADQLAAYRLGGWGPPEDSREQILKADESRAKAEQLVARAKALTNAAQGGA